MANDDYIATRGGLLPVQLPYGTTRLGLYKITTNATVGFYLGQPVDLEAGGGVVAAGVTTTSPILGPVLGFLDSKYAGIPSANTTLTSAPFLAANTDAFAVVADDPNQLFVIQEDTGGTALTAAEVGSWFTLTPRTSSGNSVTGQSTFELDRSTVVQTTAGQVMLVDLATNMNSDGTDNSYGNFAKLTVKIARHRLAFVGAVAGI